MKVQLFVSAAMAKRVGRENGAYIVICRLGDEVIQIGDIVENMKRPDILQIGIQKAIALLNPTEVSELLINIDSRFVVKSLMVSRYLFGLFGGFREDTLGNSEIGLTRALVTELYKFTNVGLSANRDCFHLMTATSLAKKLLFKHRLPKLGRYPLSEYPGTFLPTHTFVFKEFKGFSSHAVDALAPFPSDSPDEDDKAQAEFESVLSPEHPEDSDPIDS